MTLSGWIFCFHLTTFTVAYFCVSSCLPHIFADYSLSWHSTHPPNKKESPTSPEHSLSLKSSWLFTCLHITLHLSNTWKSAQSTRRVLKCLKEAKSNSARQVLCLVPWVPIQPGQMHLEAWGAKLGRVKMWVGGFGGLREWRTIHIMRTSELT